MLDVQNVNVFYGNIQALKDVSIEIKDNQVVALIGANGAGKTTIIRTIAGFLRPASGSIGFLGKQISKKNPAEIVQMGIAQSPEGRRLFPQMTVIENLEMGAYSRRHDKDEKEKDLEWVFGLFPSLRERSKQLASTLSGGEQQMLAIGRALMAHPKLLLLDEPSMGLAPNLVRTIFEIIQRISSQGITILLVEQNAFIALSIADRAYVLETGRILMEDTGASLLSNPDIKKYYLGEKIVPRNMRR
ncbi:MAG: ABC transporter ATP-binding protein [Bradyrhizobiaceae bacterium]|nr:ABC transporter ATP-binding protein [Bradyrhizobiaceae bacterium]